jgi:hypothetical protein
MVLRFVSRCWLALALAGCASAPPAAAPTDAAPGTTPPAAPIDVPSLGFFSDIKVPDSHAAVLRLAARGVLIFRCEPRPGKSYVWAFRLPEAALLDPGGNVVGRHGAGYSFELADGSRLIGQPVAHDSAPRQGDLPWLLLTARSFGEGGFTGVTHIQRVNTVGGMPPASCDPTQQNRLLRVDFSADFIFYRPR